jgi:hypothetical protein
LPWKKTNRGDRTNGRISGWPRRPAASRQVNQAGGRIHSLGSFAHTKMGIKLVVESARKATRRRPPGPVIHDPDPRFEKHLPMPCGVSRSTRREKTCRNWDGWPAVLQWMTTTVSGFASPPAFNKCRGILARSGTPFHSQGKEKPIQSGPRRNRPAHVGFFF